MKKAITLLLFLMLVVCCNNQQQQSAISPQTSENNVAAAVEQLMNAMITIDENTLGSILAEELVYGHSGGKVQDKSEFTAEILSGEPLKYKSIELLDQTIRMAGNVAVVRHIFTSKTINSDGTPGNLRVGNTLVWQLQDGKWKLLVRQAYRL
jgi:ketosteroid isomerase-like protein